jgi:hypothetical protein
MGIHRLGRALLYTLQIGLSYVCLAKPGEVPQVQGNHLIFSNFM